MLLALEDPAATDGGGLKIAMLLDEPPSRLYMPGSLGGEPWRAGGPLATAAADAARYARAWLTVVYRDDHVRYVLPARRARACGG